VHGGDASGAGADWYRAEKLDPIARFLARYAVAHKQVKGFAFNTDDPTDVYKTVREKAEFLAHGLDVDYPFPKRVAPAVDDERFKQGEAFFHERKCLACHVAGDPSAPGTSLDIKAPNFALTHERLRYDWVVNWVQDPQAFMPGTNMPQVFPGGASAFATLTEEQRTELEGKFGKTGSEQISLLIDFIYELGNRRYTTTQPVDAAAASGEATSQPATDFDF